jgi:hypothetical protein
MGPFGFYYAGGVPFLEIAGKVGKSKNTAILWSEISCQ